MLRLEADQDPQNLVTYGIKNNVQKGEEDHDQITEKTQGDQEIYRKGGNRDRHREPEKTRVVGRDSEKQGAENPRRIQSSQRDMVEGKVIKGRNEKGGQRHLQEREEGAQEQDGKDDEGVHGQDRETRKESQRQTDYQESDEKDQAGQGSAQRDQDQIYKDYIDHQKVGVEHRHQDRKQVMQELNTKALDTEA